ncbi:MAG: hypothetical protein QNI92_13260 [Desulfobacterales bacterium]|nr:hypothetical protein [Desulfobacterales bacterium]MDJ0912647.1 hypothetical protein [Desulfobacterales bacterium]
MTKHCKVIMSRIVLAVFLVGLTACTITKGEAQNKPASAKPKGVAPRYHDFDDVLVPGELKRDAKSSFTINTPGSTTGVLALKGRVDTSSLVVFFENNMLKDNWEPVSAFKSSRTILLYYKANRWCIIHIEESGFSTLTEVWVAPSMSKTNPRVFE